jgi:hypothetical protein
MRFGANPPPLSTSRPLPRSKRANWPLRSPPVTVVTASSKPMWSTRSVETKSHGNPSSSVQTTIIESSALE